MGPMSHNILSGAGHFFTCFSSSALYSGQPITDDWMKGISARPGGQLTSRPVWSSTPKVFDHAGFFCFRWRVVRRRP